MLKPTLFCRAFSIRSAECSRDAELLDLLVGRRQTMTLNCESVNGRKGSLNKAAAWILRPARKGCAVLLCVCSCVVLIVSRMDTFRVVRVRETHSKICAFGRTARSESSAVVAGPQHPQQHQKQQHQINNNNISSNSSGGEAASTV